METIVFSAGGLQSTSVRSNAAGFFANHFQHIIQMIFVSEFGEHLTQRLHVPRTSVRIPMRLKAWHRCIANFYIRRRCNVRLFRYAAAVRFSLFAFFTC